MPTQTLTEQPWNVNVWQQAAASGASRRSPLSSRHGPLDRSRPGQGSVRCNFLAQICFFPILVIDSIYTYICVCVPCCCHSATTIATDDVDTICCCCCWVTKLGIYCKATRRVRRADLSLGTSFYEILFWFIYIKNYVFPLSHCPGGAHKVWYLFNAFLLWHFPQLQIG